MWNFDFRLRRKRLKLTQAEVARLTGLANSSICRFEMGEIPYYYGRNKLDSFYKSLELKEIAKLVGRDITLAREVIVEKLRGTETQQATQTDLSWHPWKKRMRELIELLPCEFLEAYERLSRPEAWGQAA